MWKGVSLAQHKILDTRTLEGMGNDHLCGSSIATVELVDNEVGHRESGVAVRPDCLHDQADRVARQRFSRPNETVKRVRSVDKAFYSRSDQG